MQNIEHFDKDGLKHTQTEVKTTLPDKEGSFLRTLHL